MVWKLGWPDRRLSEWSEDIAKHCYVKNCLSSASFIV